MKVKVIRQLKIIMAYIIIFSLVFSLSGLSQEMNAKAEQEEITNAAVAALSELNGENDAVSYTISSVLSEDRMSVQVKLNLTPKDHINIREVVLPDGTIHQADGEGISYTAMENGGLTFLIKYIEDVECGSAPAADTGEQVEGTDTETVAEENTCEPVVEEEASIIYMVDGIGQDLKEEHIQDNDQESIIESESESEQENTVESECGTEQGSGVETEISKDTGSGVETEIGKDTGSSEKPEKDTAETGSEVKPEMIPDTGSSEKSEAVPDSESAEELENGADSNAATQSENELTIGKLRSMKQNAAANVDLSVPIYRDYDQSLMGYYSFPGGNIENIEDQVFFGLPYQFTRAEVVIGQGANSKSYHINYYDTVNGIEYYGLANESDETVPDYQIAYELPDDAVVKFIYSLRTNEHRINVVNTLPDFNVEFLYGAESGADGEFTSRFNNPVKVKLTYPTGYCVTADNGKTPVGIAFSDPDLSVTSVSNLDERTIIYDFICPDSDLELTVTGDEDMEPLTYGVYDNTSGFGRLEEGENYIKVLNADGTYVDGSTWYGCDGRIREQAVRGGTSKKALITNTNGSSVPTEKNTATGTFSSGEDLYFEYYMDRFERARVHYIYWPSPVLTFNYYPSGMDYSTSIPLSKSIVMWNPGWNVGTDIPEYDLGDGVRIKLEIKQNDVTLSEDNQKPVRYKYKVGITIRNVKNSFYLRTGSASSIQAPHYIRDTTGVSAALYDNKTKYDSYIMYDPSDTHGADAAQLNLGKGTGFLDKQAIGNEFFGEGHGVPPSVSNTGIAFKFAVTPERGYVYPIINSYDDSGSSPVSTIKPVELQVSSMNELTLGNYSWFHEDHEGREEISPFQYVSFMPVQAYNSIHNLRAVDIDAEKVTGKIKGVDADNPIVSKGENFDLLENDKIVFNNDYVPAHIPGKTFVGFYATISPEAGNNPLLPDYSRELYKNQEGTAYFQPGDVVSVSDYYYQNAAMLQDSWEKNGTLSEDDRKHLLMLMFTSKYEVNIIPEYKDGEHAEGGLVTGYINKYLQDVTASGLVYEGNPADTRSIRAVSGSNLVITNFAPEFLYPADGYTYYLNKDRTTSVNRVDEDQSELASVKYDRGLTVSYKNAQGNDFDGIADTNIYRTFDGENTADIRFPTAGQTPVGKAFDYWKVEERVSADDWLIKSGMEIRPDAGNTARYVFSSGLDSNNKSIRLTAVWKDILPSDYITIPKKIILLDNGTNLSPADDYAGAKVTIEYRSVNGNDRSLAVDVRKSFELSLSADESKKIEVKSYRPDGQLLSTDGVNPDYARIGLLNSGSPEQTIYFNTDSRDGPAYYQGNFTIDSGDSSGPGTGTLFYIYPAN
ncbi:hypothetical protein [uncultured Robinsoniella sp.]|uniref:hypothetical protein n=1 Tax=uncultured Robinsoniella sp. TaxID=904190 RepID=UPI00374E8649